MSTIIYDEDSRSFSVVEGLKGLAKAVFAAKAARLGSRALNRVEDKTLGEEKTILGNFTGRNKRIRRAKEAAAQRKHEERLAMINAGKDPDEDSIGTAMKRAALRKLNKVGTK